MNCNFQTPRSSESNQTHTIEVLRQSIAERKNKENLCLNAVCLENEFLLQKEKEEKDELTRKL